MTSRRSIETLLVAHALAESPPRWPAAKVDAKRERIRELSRSPFMGIDYGSLERSVLSMMVIDDPLPLVGADGQTAVLTPESLRAGMEAMMRLRPKPPVFPALPTRAAARVVSPGMFGHAGLPVFDELRDALRSQLETAIDRDDPETAAFVGEIRKLRGGDP